jgi:hypothetical protein
MAQLSLIQAAHPDRKIVWVSSLVVVDRKCPAMATTFRGYRGIGVYRVENW